MRSPVLLFPLFAAVLCGQAPVEHKKMIARLGSEADLFERTAYRIAGIEKLVQTVPDKARVGRTLRGVETLLPGYTREIVSEYGFVSMDAPGGSLKEVRRVITIDGHKWAKAGKSLKALGREMTDTSDKGRQKSLENFESYGLNGFVTDLGQLILLFARGGAARYEFNYEGVVADGTLAFSYVQLDGNEAVTVFGEAAKPVRQKLHGRIWAQQHTLRPTRISIESVREYDQIPTRDVSTVDYFPSDFGILLPMKIVHQQHVRQALVVTDEFTYSNFHQVLPPSRR